MDPSQATPIVTPVPEAPVLSTANGEAVPKSVTPAPAVEAPVVPSVPGQVEDVIVPDPSLVPDELSLNKPEAVPTTVTATGNKKIDAVGQLLADKGVPNADSIINEVVTDGEISLANHAALVDALGEAMAGIVLSQLEGEVTAVRDTATAERSRLMDYTAEAFGEKAEDAAEVWQAVQDFAKSPEAGLSEADRAAMNQMLSQGGLQAELVIDKLKSKYYASNNYTQEADLLVGESTVNSSFEAIGKAAYTKQMSEVARDFGYDSPEAERLRAKRNESIQRGY